jgi:hypothetical protein
VRRINLNDFVSLGESLRSARLVKDDAEPTDAFIGTMWLGDNLKKLLADDVFGTGILKHDCETLIKVIQDIEEYPATDDADDRHRFRWFIISRLKNSLQSFTSVFAAECRQASTYNVDRIGIYSTGALIESASLGLAEEVRSVISDLAKAEYDSSARCLAFRLPTAAGFHIMRAVEFVLVPYVQAFSGRSFESLNTNWGSYIAHLEQIIKSGKRKKPKSQNIDLLRQLKNNHRNPVMHADLILSEQEAQDVFSIGGVVINALALELISHGAPNQRTVIGE